MLQILVVFKSAPELCNLLKTVEEEYMKAREHSRTRLDGPHADVLPWIQSQAQAFEAGATATVRDARITPAVSALLFVKYSHTQGTHQKLLTE